MRVERSFLIENFGINFKEALCWLHESRNEVGPVDLGEISESGKVKKNQGILGSDF